MAAVDPIVFRELPLIRKIILDETWLEGERRGCPGSARRSDCAGQGMRCDFEHWPADARFDHPDGAAPFGRWVGIGDE